MNGLDAWLPLVANKTIACAATCRWHCCTESEWKQLAVVGRVEHCKGVRKLLVLAADYLRLLDSRYGSLRRWVESCSLEWRDEPCVEPDSQTRENSAGRGLFPSSRCSLEFGSRGKGQGWIDVTSLLAWHSHNYCA